LSAADALPPSRAVPPYEKVTEGIRVRVTPGFSLGKSSPAEGKFVFTYDIEILNEGSESARLLFRHWDIHDAAGEDQEVDGDGVLGEQPLLPPRGVHRYRSYCVLTSTVGWMEGFYTFERVDGERFRVAVPRFHFRAPVLSMPEEDAPGVMH